MSAAIVSAAAATLQRDARMALMLKSVVGLVDTGLFEDVDTVSELLGEIAAGDIDGLLTGATPLEGVDAFVRLLRDLGPLVNQELIELLLTSPDPVFHATDIIDGLQKGVQFVVDDPKVFLRTSVVDFDAFATLLGVYGSFYAAYGPADRAGVGDWLDACAEPIPRPHLAGDRGARRAARPDVRRDLRRPLQPVPRSVRHGGRPEPGRRSRREVSAGIRRHRRAHRRRDRPVGGRTCGVDRRRTDPVPAGLR